MSSKLPLIICCITGCGRAVTAGGVKGERPKCALHYQRQRRNPNITDAELAAPAGAKVGKRREKVTFRPSPALLKRLEQTHRAQKRGTGGPLAGKVTMSFGELIERAVTAGLEAWEAWDPKKAATAHVDSDHEE